MSDAIFKISISLREQGRDRKLSWWRMEPARRSVPHKLTYLEFVVHDSRTDCLTLRGLASMDDFSTRIATRKKRSRDFFVFKLLDPAVCINRLAAPKHHKTTAGHSLNAIAFPIHDAEFRPDQFPLRIIGQSRHRHPRCVCGRTPAT